MSVVDHPIFDPRHTSRIHSLQLALALAVVVLAIVRMTRPVPFTRGQITALTMGLKSIGVIQYQFVTTHIPAFRRWKNLAAFAIFNTLEIVTWPISVAFQFLGIAQVCIGKSCDLQKAAAALSVVILVVALQPAISSTLDYAHRRKYNTDRGQEQILMK